MFGKSAQGFGKRFLQLERQGIDRNHALIFFFEMAIFFCKITVKVRRHNEKVNFLVSFRFWTRFFKKSCLQWPCIAKLLHPEENNDVRDFNQPSLYTPVYFFPWKNK